MGKNREATRTAIETIEKFIQDIDEIIMPEHRNIILESAKGSLMFCLQIIREETEIYE